MSSGGAYFQVSVLRIAASVASFSDSYSEPWAAILWPQYLPGSKPHEHRNVYL